MALDTLDFNKKILHASWHPRENTIAVRVFQSPGSIGQSAESLGADRSLRRTTCSCTARHECNVCFVHKATHACRPDVCPYVPPYSLPSSCCRVCSSYAHAFPSSFSYQYLAPHLALRLPILAACPTIQSRPPLLHARTHTSPAPATSLTLPHPFRSAVQTRAGRTLHHIRPILVPRTSRSTRLVIP